MLSFLNINTKQHLRSGQVKDRLPTMIYHLSGEECSIMVKHLQFPIGANDLLATLLAMAPDPLFELAKNYGTQPGHLQ